MSLRRVTIFVLVAFVCCFVQWSLFFSSDPPPQPPTRGPRQAATNPSLDDVTTRQPSVGVSAARDSEAASEALTLPQATSPPPPDQMTLRPSPPPEPSPTAHQGQETPLPQKQPITPPRNSVTKNVITSTISQLQQPTSWQDLAKLKGELKKSGDLRKAFGDLDVRVCLWKSPEPPVIGLTNQLYEYVATFVACVFVGCDVMTPQNDLTSVAVMEEFWPGSNYLLNQNISRVTDSREIAAALAALDVINVQHCSEVTAEQLGVGQGRSLVRYSPVKVDRLFYGQGHSPDTVEDRLRTIILDTIAESHRPDAASQNAAIVHYVTLNLTLPWRSMEGAQWISVFQRHCDPAWKVIQPVVDVALQLYAARHSDQSSLRRLYLGDAAVEPEGDLGGASPSSSSSDDHHPVDRLLSAGDYCVAHLRIELDMEINVTDTFEFWRNLAFGKWRKDCDAWVLLSGVFTDRPLHEALHGPPNATKQSKWSNKFRATLAVFKQFLELRSRPKDGVRVYFLTRADKAHRHVVSSSGSQNDFPVVEQGAVSVDIARRARRFFGYMGSSWSWYVDSLRRIDEEKRTAKSIQDNNSSTSAAGSTLFYGYAGFQIMIGEVYNLKRGASLNKIIRANGGDAQMLCPTT